ncbi:hypothetical protein G6F55_013976 [Rhizopus delemar]|nr:hypothetical protein G6F55_013976 [Rhizopus delemar]
MWTPTVATTSWKPTHALPATAIGSVRITCCNAQASNPRRRRSAWAMASTSRSWCASRSVSSPGAASLPAMQVMRISTAPCWKPVLRSPVNGACDRAWG